MINFRHSGVGWSPEGLESCWILAFMPQRVFARMTAMENESKFFRDRGVEKMAVKGKFSSFLFFPLYPFPLLFPLNL
ncbi:hypothetical protein JYT26_02120 [Beggiatoa alba]|nr:hypothetical protein [Beggiatoa alba]